MGFFFKPKKSGWMVVAIHTDGVFAAAVGVRAGAKPLLKRAQFFSTAKRSLPEVLERIAKDLRLETYHCMTLLGGGEYQMLTVDAPAVPAAEMRTAVRWRLKDLLDFPAEQATIDVLDIPVDSAQQSRGAAIFAVAAFNKTVEMRQKLFADAGIEMRTIDIPEMAQRNISNLLEAPGRGVAMLSFDPDGGLLTVTYEGELYLARRIDVSLAQLLDPEHERRLVSYDKITLELQRSLDHFERQYNFISVAKLVLAPTGSSGLDAYLSSNLYTPVETLDLATLFDLGPAGHLAELSQQQRFFLPLGAALRDAGSAP
jgi:MSHA biogenesis protein MshI